MTKTQKIWLGIFLAMFIVPEVLWSPVGNYIYEFSKIGGSIVPLRHNFLSDSNGYHFFWYGLIILVQIFGLGLTIFSLSKNYKMIQNKPTAALGIILASVFLLLALFAFYFISFVNVSFP